MLLVRPLHRRARAIALGQAEVIAHAEFVAIANDGSAGQGEQEAVGEFQPFAVALEHRREPAADAAVVELHVRLRPERSEHLLALAFAEAAEVELVMITQENAPLGGRRSRLGDFHGVDQRLGIAARQRIEEVLIDLEIEHHVHAVAVVPEIFHVVLGQDVGFGEHDAVAAPPLQEFPERAQHVELFVRLGDRRTLGGDDERHGVHAKTGDTKLDPEAHDLQDLRLHFRIGGVEVGLEIVESMVVIGLGRVVPGPGGLLHAGKHHPLVGILRLGLRPDIPVAIFGIGIASGLPEPRMFVRGVVDDEVDQDADAALLGGVGEFDEIAERAIARVDGVEITNIVAVVAVGCGLKRHQPDRRYAKPIEIIETPHQAGKVADAVTIGVHEAADGEALDHRVFVPKVVDHRLAPKRPCPLHHGERKGSAFWSDNTLTLSG